MATEKYPRWRERWDARVNDIDNEIESWWARTKADFRGADTPREAAAGAWEQTQRAGDRIGDRLAGRNDPDTMAERIGDTGRNWWADVKNKVADWFDGDDDEVRAEYRQAWDDPDYLGQRFEERRAELQKRGKLS
jgi:hypothetical protein